MCGNEISSVSNPGGEFYNLVATQIPSGRVLVSNFSFILENFPMSPAHGA
jgi:hypothetical protein